MINYRGWSIPRVEREIDLNNATYTSTSSIMLDITPTHSIISMDVTTLEHYGSTNLEDLNMVEKRITPLVVQFSREQGWKP